MIIYNCPSIFCSPPVFDNKLTSNSDSASETKALMVKSSPLGLLTKMGEVEKFSEGNDSDVA